jgi:hypothetical protein
MTNEMHRFFIYLSIYFCLICFGLSFSPFSEADVLFRQWFKYAGYGVSARALTLFTGDWVARGCEGDLYAVARFCNVDIQSFML